jgi:DNA transposition AAA+ family ATPase
MSNAINQANQDKIVKISRWLETQQAAGRNMSQGILARKAAISGTTVSQVLKGKYPSDVTAHLDKLLEVIEVEDERAADGTPGYVKGSVHKLMWVVADRTRKHRSFGVVTGFVGVGKTRTCEEYKKAKSGTLLVPSSPQMTPGVLLAKMLEQLGVSAPRGGLDVKFEEVVRLLKGTNHLIIVDEAENCSSLALHYLRRVRDMAEVGIVLVGTEKLHALIAPQRGQFDQIRSRVAMWPKTIESISRDDADDIAREALREAFGDVPDDVLDVLWQYAKGSARVLAEALVSSIKDYAPRGQALTTKVVDHVASKVLNMQKGAL